MPPYQQRNHLHHGEEETHKNQKEGKEDSINKNHSQLEHKSKDQGQVHSILKYIHHGGVRILILRKKSKETNQMMCLLVEVLNQKIR